MVAPEDDDVEFAEQANDDEAESDYPLETETRLEEGFAAEAETNDHLYDPDLSESAVTDLAEDAGDGASYGFDNATATGSFDRSKLKIDSDLVEAVAPTGDSDMYELPDSEDLGVSEDSYQEEANVNDSGAYPTYEGEAEVDGFAEDADEGARGFDAYDDGAGAEGEGDTYAEGEGDTYAEGEGDTYAEGEGDTYAEGGDTYAEGGDTYAEGEGDTYAEGEADTYAEGEADTYAEGEADTYAEGGDTYAEGGDTYAEGGEVALPEGEAGYDEGEPSDAAGFSVEDEPDAAGFSVEDEPDAAGFSVEESAEAEDEGFADEEAPEESTAPRPKGKASFRSGLVEKNAIDDMFARAAKIKKRS